MVLKFSFSLLAFGGLLACGPNTNVSGKSSSDENLSRGQLLYETHCILCHGEKGDLGNSGAKNLVVSKMKDAEIIQLIEEGKNAMPPIPQLMESTKDMDSILVYVKSLRK